MFKCLNCLLKLSLGFIILNEVLINSQWNWFGLYRALFVMRMVLNFYSKFIERTLVMVLRHDDKNLNILGYGYIHGNQMWIVDCRIDYNDLIRYRVD